MMKPLLNGTTRELMVHLKTSEIAEAAGLPGEGWKVGHHEVVVLSRPATNREMRDYYAALDGEKAGGTIKNWDWKDIISELNVAVSTCSYCYPDQMFHLYLTCLVDPAEWKAALGTTSDMPPDQWNWDGMLCDWLHPYRGELHDTLRDVPFAEWVSTEGIECHLLDEVDFRGEPPLKLKK